MAGLRRVWSSRSLVWGIVDYGMGLSQYDGGGLARYDQCVSADQRSGLSTYKPTPSRSGAHRHCHLRPNFVLLDLFEDVPRVRSAVDRLAQCVRSHSARQDTPVLLDCHHSSLL
jgi:hypothetical protein